MLYSYCLISPSTGNLYALYIEIRNANMVWKACYLKLDGRDLLLKLSSHCWTKRKKPCLDNDRKVRTRYKTSESSSSFLRRIWTLCYVRRSGKLQWPDEKRGVRAGRPRRRPPVLAASSLARWVASRFLSLLRSSCVLPLDRVLTREHSGDMCVVFSMCIRVPDE